MLATDFCSFQESTALEIDSAKHVEETAGAVVLLFLDGWCCGKNKKKRKKKCAPGVVYGSAELPRITK